jgi:hypothetical protein
MVAALAEIPRAQGRGADRDRSVHGRSLQAERRIVSWPRRWGPGAVAATCGTRGRGRRASGRRLPAPRALRAGRPVQPAPHPHPPPPQPVGPRCTSLPASRMLKLNRRRQPYTMPRCTNKSPERCRARAPRPEWRGPAAAHPRLETRGQCLRCRARRIGVTAAPNSQQKKAGSVLCWMASARANSHSGTGPRQSSLFAPPRQAEWAGRGGPGRTGARARGSSTQAARQQSQARVSRPGGARCCLAILPVRSHGCARPANTRRQQAGRAGGGRQAGQGVQGRAQGSVPAPCSCPPPPRRAARLKARSKAPAHADACRLAQARSTSACLLRAAGARCGGAWAGRRRGGGRSRARTASAGGHGRFEVRGRGSVGARGAPPSDAGRPAAVASRTHRRAGGGCPQRGVLCADPSFGTKWDRMGQNAGGQRTGAVERERAAARAAARLPRERHHWGWWLGREGRWHGPSLARASRGCSRRGESGRGTARRAASAAPSGAVR